MSLLDRILGRSGTRPAQAAVKPPDVVPEALDFQDELDIVIAEPAPRFVGTPHLVAAGMLVALVIFAGFAETDVVVVGDGRIATDSPPIVIQPIERSVLREIKVRPGDVVRVGQVLATLDPTFTDADRDALSARERSLAAELRRLDREIAGLPVPPEEEVSADPDTRLQATLHAQRIGQYTTTLSAFDADIAAIQAAIRTAEDDRASLTDQLTVSRDVERLRQELFDAQTGSRLLLLDARSARLRTERELQSVINRLAELGHQLNSRQAERQSFMGDWRRQLLEDLVRVRAEASGTVEALAKASRLSDLIDLTAPRDGVVVDVARRSSGSVLREAESLIVLVPLDVPLIAEINLASADVGFTKPGDEVAIKIDAFPFQRFGLLRGRLRSISQESFSATASADLASGNAPPPPNARGAVHRAQVELLTIELDRRPVPTPITPGMTVRAEIKVGQRSVLSYFLFPLTRGLQEALREP
ncbi:MAG: hypothetical protein RLY86_3071 [Pseudomonadota bacterium]|jgi:HlyD family secretion protein